MAKKHIEKKDDADKASQNIAALMEQTTQDLLNLTFNQLLLNAGQDHSSWYHFQNSSFKAFKSRVDKTIKVNKKMILKATRGNIKGIELQSNQERRVENTITNSLNSMATTTIRNYRRDVAAIESNVRISKNNVADELYKTIKEKILQNQDFGIVNYKNGRNVRWENYIEMKLRTDIQQDITKNLLKAGRDAGNIFYICTYFGDCAPDHADYQGKIYYDQKWESIVSSEKKDIVEEYITSNDLLSYQSVIDGPVYLTTRPNCRHSFQTVSTEEVLGIKNDNDLKVTREKYGLNSAGKYKSGNYNDLEKQRYNERKIRHWKGKLSAQETLLKDMPDNVSEKEKLMLQSQIAQSKNKIRQWQANQRHLIKSNPILNRNYRREKQGEVISDFRIGEELTKSTKNGKINMEIDELTPCLRRISDGKIVNTIIEEINPNKKEFKDWEFDWTIPPKNGNSIYALRVEGDNRIQGMIATKPDYKDYKAVIVDIVESAPFNNPHNKYYIKKEYTGVGGHLFAFAVKQSYEFGLSGVVIFRSKTNIISHYEKELGAILINPKERLMMIDEYEARRLYERYYRRK